VPMQHLTAQRVNTASSTASSIDQVSLIERVVNFTLGVTFCCIEMSILKSSCIPV
jgi:hypothetical protein